MSARRRLELQRWIAGGRHLRQQRAEVLARIDEELAALTPDPDAAAGEKEAAESAYVVLMNRGDYQVNYRHMGATSATRPVNTILMCSRRGPDSTARSRSWSRSRRRCCGSRRIGRMWPSDWRPSTPRSLSGKPSSPSSRPRSQRDGRRHGRRADQDDRRAESGCQECRRQPGLMGAAPDHPPPISGQQALRLDRVVTGRLVGGVPGVFNLSAWSGRMAQFSQTLAYS
jgi:hypothetical protein